MATIRHHARVARPADDVWKVVSDPLSITDWFAGVDSAVMDGQVRRISFGGMEIGEQIVTSDDALRRFQYSIVDGPTQPEYHLVTIDVLDDGDGSLVIYSCEVQPDEGRELFGPVYGQALDSLKAHLER